MKLLPHEPARMMSRVLDPEVPPVVIDVGANVGDTCAVFVDEFPNAVVYALEPVSDVFATLQERCRSMPGVRPFRLAVGEQVGEAVLNVTRNRWCSSLLAPSERGKAYYGDWYDVVRSETVPLTTLDHFAVEQGIEQVDILKIDVQGLELPVLRGTRQLLQAGRVKIVQCEAQLVPEYQGASTFSEIDQFLRECGLTIHQIYQLEVKGQELQSSYLDAVWMRNDVLEELRRNPTPVEHRCVKLMRRALRRCVQAGHSRVAIYGAGQHTVRSAGAFNNPAVQIVGIIDDNVTRHGESVAGLTVISKDQARRLGATAIVLSSDAHEDALWERSEPLRRHGIAVERLYQPCLVEAKDFAKAATTSIGLSSGDRASQRSRIASAVARCAEIGAKRVAVFGAGRHTRRELAAFEAIGSSWVVVIDDHPDAIGAYLCGRPTVSSAQAAGLGLDAIVLSSDCHEATMWEATKQFRARGVCVIPVYGSLDASGMTYRHGVVPPAAGVSAPGMTGQNDPASLSAPPDRPEGAFRFPYYQGLTQRRLEHLASLPIGLRSKSVLEIGAGVGELTSFFADRDCLVHATDAREDNLKVLQETNAHNPRVKAWRLDAEQPPSLIVRKYDLVFCYGLLYHLRDPLACLDFMAQSCEDALLLETVVSRGTGDSICECYEDAAYASQALRGIGCRPTRGWVMARLQERFPHVYVTRTQPAHREFPTDWTQPAEERLLSRAVFVASRRPVQSPLLLTELPMHQDVHA